MSTVVNNAHSIGEVTDLIRDDFAGDIALWVQGFEGDPTQLCQYAFRQGDEYACGAAVAYLCAMEIAKLLSIGALLLMETKKGWTVKAANLREAFKTKIKTVFVQGDASIGNLHFLVEVTS